MHMRITRRTLLAATAAAAPFGLTRASAQTDRWKLLDDGSGPLARWDHVLTADAANGRLYVFGGRDANGVALGDLWSFDLASSGWTPIESAGPSPRFGVAASATPDGSSFVLFGGQADADFYADLWTFDFASQTWTLLDDGLAVAPTPRYGLGGAFDALGRFIVSHGFTFEGRFDDTWAFSRETGWLDVSPAPETRPLRRCLHEVTPIDNGERLLLYAGCSSGYGPCPQGDLWEYETASGTWTQLAPSIVPAARSNPATAQLGDSVLLVGGQTEFGPAADVWYGARSSDGFEWQEATDDSGIIAPRSSHDLVTLDSEAYIFGGLGVAGPLADLWQYTSGA